MKFTICPQTTCRYSNPGPETPLAAKVDDDLQHGSLRWDEACPRQPCFLEESAGSWAAIWAPEEEPVPEGQHLPPTSPSQDPWGPYVSISFTSFTMILNVSLIFSWERVTEVMGFQQKSTELGTSMLYLSDMKQTQGPYEIQWTRWLQVSLFGRHHGVQQLWLCKDEQQVSGWWEWSAPTLRAQGFLPINQVYFPKHLIITNMYCDMFPVARLRQPGQFFEGPFHGPVPGGDVCWVMEAFGTPLA